MRSVRNPVVAGQFYPGRKEELAKTVNDLLPDRIKKKDVIGVVSPHAGYEYSGEVAAETLSAIMSKSTYIIIGPNHTGLGLPFSISRADSWRTPLGEVNIDRVMREAILGRSSLIKADDAAHEAEHSIEVQLPFLQVLAANFQFVPIIVAAEDFDLYKTAGTDIAGAIRGLGRERDTVIIASSDMTHYEPDATARKKDKSAIDAILRLDEESLKDAVVGLDISMCGYGPVCVMLSAAKELKAKQAKLIKYRTSGDVSGDYSSVVGYAGIIIY